jgi:hypothetical protein
MSAPPRLINSLKPYFENSSSPLAIGMGVARLIAASPSMSRHEAD